MIESVTSTRGIFKHLLQLWMPVGDVACWRDRAWPVLPQGTCAIVIVPFLEGTIFPVGQTEQRITGRSYPNVSTVIGEVKSIYL
jgi:hypothetical protein